MSDSTPDSQPPPVTDSPWLWVMLFCGACLLLLAVVAPKYSARQRRLEMQYMAQEEILRRGADGAESLPVQTAPPAAGELIIPLWPLAALFTVVMATAAAMLRRSRRAWEREHGQPPPGETS